MTTVFLLWDGVVTKLCTLLLMLTVLLQSDMCNDGAENRIKKFEFHSHTLSRDITEEWVVLTDVIRTLRYRSDPKSGGGHCLLGHQIWLCKMHGIFTES